MQAFSKRQWQKHIKKGSNSSRRFGSVGHVLQCKHGDVFVYNPTHPHGTTEFDLHPNEPESGRIFFAFFMKKSVLHADLLSQAMVNRVGVQNIKLP